MIKTQNYGKHPNVLIAEFGKGDVRLAKGRPVGEDIENHLIFYNQTPPRKIGEVSNDDAGLSTDDSEAPSLVMVFENPQSITALIHSLIELQKNFF